MEFGQEIYKMRLEQVSQGIGAKSKSCEMYWGTVIKMFLLPRKRTLSEHHCVGLQIGEESKPALPEDNMFDTEDH